MKKLFAILFFLSLPIFSFAEDKIKVLVVPGHDNTSSGSMFRTTKEVTLTRIVAQKITAFLSKDSRIEVVNLHQGDDYAPFMQAYFESDLNKISEWRKTIVSSFRKKQDSGEIKKVSSVPHAAPPIDVINRLYGINKWAGESGVDLALHVHFNDYGSHKWGTVGKFTGFAIYTPEDQFPNASSSFPISQAIFDGLEKIMYKSDNVTEAKFEGPIKDQTLIALGAYGSLPKEVSSVLVEYSYVYEPAIQNYFSVASTIFADVSARAIKQALFQDTFETAFGYSWQKNLKEKDKGSDVLVLQYALKSLGFFPPEGKNREDCPIAGYFGDCTKEALKKFQEIKNISAVGVFGPQTRKLFNSMFVLK